MRFTALLLFGILFTANSLKSQNGTKDLTIFGQVKVQVGKEVTKPLEYVWIEIKELKNITLADSLGYFKLNRITSYNVCYTKLLRTYSSGFVTSFPT